MASDILQFSDEGRRNHRLNKNALELLAKGGTADVYTIKDKALRHLALKIYRKPDYIDWGRIIFQISKPIDKIDALFADIPSYAWPVGLITADKKNIGIVLPYIDRTRFVTLDNWVEGHLIDKLSEENKSLSRKILLLKNIAELIATLHKKKCSIVDLKPANFLIHKLEATSCLLDCDSLRIVENNNRVYSATHVSPGYIAPEALIEETPVSELGTEQDLFAFAVMAFQILNYGIHPFQGILSKDVQAHSQDDKVKRRLYPYGGQPVRGVKPLPQSVHDTFSSEITQLFNKAFLGKPDQRPTAKEWLAVLENFLTNRMLERCQKRPKDPSHIRFEGKDCPACTRAGAIKTIAPQKTKRLKSQPVSDNPRGHQPVNASNQKSSVPTIVWVVLGILFMSFLISQLGSANLEVGISPPNLNAPGRSVTGTTPRADLNARGRSATGTTGRPKAAKVDEDREYWRNYWKEKSGDGPGVYKWDAATNTYTHTWPDNVNPRGRSATGTTPRAEDTSFWNSMKDSGDITSYQAYLEQFPSGSYVSLAWERINSVRESIKSEVNGR
jgi:serine/threonine protein kinase